MKITLITATYNSEKNIDNCIKSVAAQTYQNIEHIVIDGGSTDNTVNIVKNSPLISKWISESDKGIYDALNKGIKMATGDIIGFLHSDDMLAGFNTLQNIVDSFSQSNADGIYGNLIFVDDKNKVFRTWFSKPFSRINVRFGWAPPHPTLFLRTEVYQKHGLFEPSFRISGDYDFMLRIMLDEELNFLMLNEVITSLRLGGASTGNLKSQIKKMKEDIRALRNNGFRMPYFTMASKRIRKLPQLIKQDYL